MSFVATRGMGGPFRALCIDCNVSATGLRLLVPAEGDFGAAFGAAKLAAAAATGATGPEVFAQPEVGAEIAPDAKLADLYAKKYEAYMRGYPATRDLA